MKGLFCCWKCLGLLLFWLPIFWLFSFFFFFFFFFATGHHGIGNEMPLLLLEVSGFAVILASHFPGFFLGGGVLFFFLFCFVLFFVLQQGTTE